MFVYLFVLMHDVHRCYTHGDDECDMLDGCFGVVSPPVVSSNGLGLLDPAREESGVFSRM